MKEKMKNNYGLLVSTILILFFVLYMVFDSQKIREYKKTFKCFGENINVSLYTKSPKQAREATKEIEKILTEYDKLTSREQGYENVQNLYSINHFKGKSKDIEISSTLGELLQYGLSLKEKSDGLINLEIGPIVDAYNQAGTEKKLETIDLSTNKLVFLDDTHTENNHPNLYTSLFVKGYVNEKIKAYLESINLDMYLINTGGNIIAGKHYENGKYQLGLDDTTKKNIYYKVIEAKEDAISTKTREGKEQLLLPPSYQRASFMNSITVVGESSTKTEFLSNMLFMKSKEEGDAYLEKHKVHDVTEENTYILYYHFKDGSTETKKVNIEW